MLDPDHSPICEELVVSNISADEFEFLYESLSCKLESLRIKIDFQNTDNSRYKHTRYKHICSDPYFNTAHPSLGRYRWLGRPTHQSR